MVAQALSPRGTGTTRRLGGRGASGTDTTGRVGTAWAAPRWSRPPFCYWRAAWPVAYGDPKRRELAGAAAAVPLRVHVIRGGFYRPLLVLSTDS
jgi:hypothetical protein